MDNENIFAYIVDQENFYRTRGVPLSDNWEWKMFDHIKRSKLYKNSQIESGNPNDQKPIKNIIRPILNVAYRSEGFDVKDIQPFVDDSKDYWKSFLVKKYHAKWARKFSIDTFIDDMVESYVDYGGALVKNINQQSPSVVPLDRIAFCDQTDMLSGVIGEKHPYTPDQLVDMEATNGWNKDNIKTAIQQARQAKTVPTSTLGAKTAITPQKYIDVYELHGMMPAAWLLEDDADQEALDKVEFKYVNQVQIVTFGNSENKENKKGLTLFKGVEKKPIYKLVLRDKIYGRALGFGGVEELFEAQMWTTYNQIKIKGMLDAAALMLLQTDDPSFASKNKIEDLEAGEIIELAAGKTISQVSFQPQNIEIFNKLTDAWDEHAKETGSATDPIMGNEPAAGTPFALQQLLTQQGKGLHEYRQGLLADFMGEIYRDWILPYFSKELRKGDTWIEDLSLEEMQWCADQLAEAEVTARAIAAFKTGSYITQQDSDQIRQLVKTSFSKKGNKQFMEIYQNEMKKMPIDVEINIAGKQKDLSSMTDKLTNIFSKIIMNPAVLQNPGMGKLFNQIIEASGLDPVDFTQLTTPSVANTVTAATNAKNQVNAAPVNNGSQQQSTPNSGQPVAVQP